MFSKNKLNIIVDILNFFVGLISFVSGFVVWKFLPLGYGFRGGRGILTNNYSFWGLSRYNWIQIHSVSSLIFFVLIILHLILHWSWLKNLPKILKNNTSVQKE